VPTKTYVTQVIVSGVNSRVFTSYPASRLAPTLLAPIPSATTFNYGETVYGGDPVDLTRPIPLISIRLAPSVDSGLTGAIGEREIVNRMQLTLKTAGVTTNKDVEIFFILNGLPSKLTFTKVQVPSLSQLISHDSGDIIQRGTTIYSTKASAGSLDVSLNDLIDMGNSIMGGDSVFPAGPDLLTLAVQPQDTSDISAASPLVLSGKLSWSESQA
jgi:predicted peroxiredoxin